MTKFSLEDIFSDPIFEELNIEKPKSTIKRTDPDIEKFKQLIDWVQKNGGEEPKKSKDITERRMFSRLKGYRDREEMKNKLSKYDTLNLLEIENTINYELNKVPKTLDEILVMDSFFNNQTKEDSLLDLSRYKKTIKAADNYSRRKRAKDFDKYENLFKLVHREIANGTRRIIPVDTEKNIIEGKFYIDNGILLYVLSVGDYFIDKNGYRNARLHLVYENGTENNGILLRSFASNLFDKTRHGRMITEVQSDYMGETKLEDRAMENLTTGYIYVLKSLSSKPEISDLKNLYKIGFSRGRIEKRISNASNESTYLYSPVKVIASWEVQNVSAQKLEAVIHRRFDDKKVQISIPTVNGKNENPSEWYIVPFKEIEKTINDIIFNLNI